MNLRRKTRKFIEKNKNEVAEVRATVNFILGIIDGIKKYI